MDCDTDKYQVTHGKIPNDRSPYKRDTLLFKVRCHFRSYCNHTSIHGFQYFGQNRTIVEKCWWILIFIGIISCCGFAISLIYNKWQKTPVIVSLTTKDTPIHSVPFPAVTICPTIKFSKECINFSHRLNRAMGSNMDTEPTPEQRKIFSYMFPLCKIGLLMKEADLKKLEKIVSGNNSIVSHDIFDVFKNCSPFLNQVDNSAKFMDKDLKFHDDFRPLLTEDGLCFTFNMLSSKDIFNDHVYFHPGFKSFGPKSYYIPQKGYSNDAEVETYPRRALLSGAINSLEIKLLHRKRDIDYVCTGAEQGYKVILHHPTRMPRPSLEYSMVQFSKASTIAVTPKMMTTSKVVESYSPDQRDCYFTGEKQLHFFKIYSRVNCKVECLTNYTLQECGCVAFHMPREASTHICGIGKLQCVNSARKKYNLSRLKSKLLDTQNSQDLGVQQLATASKPDHGTSPAGLFGANDEKFKTPRKKRKITEEPTEDLKDDNARCGCYRTCNDLTYTGTATAMEYNWREESVNNELSNKPEIDFTFITIFLDTYTIFTTERNELYGPTDFLSNFGGLLGLFTGFSILSLMEILYFCSLRIFGNLKLLGRWYGDKEE